MSVALKIELQYISGTMTLTEASQECKIYLNWKLIFRFLWVTFSCVYAKSSFVQLLSSRKKQENKFGQQGRL